MGRPLCTVCALPAVVRKTVEALMRVSLPVRDIAEYCDFLSTKESQDYRVSKSALDRHKNADPAHFDRHEKIVINVDDEVKNLRDFVGDMFIRFQKANKDKVPTHKEMMDLLLADAKLADIEQRRKDETLIKGLLLQASYKATEVIALPSGEIDGN